MTIKSSFLTAVLSILVLTGRVYAAEILLVNGDKISGSIVAESQKTVSLNHEILGAMTIPRASIDKIISEKPAASDKGIWSGHVKGGFDRTRGNVDTTDLFGAFAVKAKREKIDEFDIGAEANYSSENREMNAQRYSGMIRYAFSFGKKKRWYQFFKAEGDHDRFANIEKRFTLSSGPGYWFSDTDVWKLMSEVGAGITYTDFRTEKSNEKEIVLIPRIFLERQLIASSKASQELTVYISLTDLGEYRFQSATGFQNPIMDQVALHVDWVNSYNSDPGAHVKKLDMRLTTSVSYDF